MQPIGTRQEGSTLTIADCAGGSCLIECGPYDTCSIGSCAGDNCVINCTPGATCTCSDTGCAIVDITP
jgi:hypothetical protein